MSLHHPLFAGIVADHRPRRLQNSRGGTVVVRQADTGGFRKVSQQPVKTGGVCSSEAVDGLVRVADDKQALAVPAPMGHQLALHRVDVLELVHQHMGKALLFCHIHLQSVPKQAIHVPGPQGLQPGLISLGHSWGQSFQGFLAAGKAVPQVGKGSPHLFRGFLAPHFREQAADFFQHLPVGEQGPPLQQGEAHPVESAHRQAPEGFFAPQLLFQTAAQLLGRRLGKGDGGDFRGLGPAALEEPGNPGDESPGLARSRPRHHGGDRRCGLHRRLLFRIQAGSRGWGVFRRRRGGLLHRLFGRLLGEDGLLCYLE